VLEFIKLLYASINLTSMIKISYIERMDGLCGQLVRVPGYRHRGTGSIPCATRFSEK
jgi:hypothetical protein